jgi:conjugal transfer pilus assembly protein TraF
MKRFWQTALGWLLMLALILPTVVQAIESSNAQAQENFDNTWWDDSVWNNQERGFIWYPPDTPLKKQDKSKPVAEKPKSIQDMKTIAEINKELDRLKEVAILNPTEKNILSFLEAQNWMFNKSSYFADATQRVVWSNPKVDYNNRSPTANNALINKRERTRKDEQQLAANLSQDYGVFFFFRSDCQYCHEQAPVLKYMQTIYGLPVIPVSMDGGRLPEYPSPRADNGISMMVSQGQGVNTFPAIYLVEKKTKQSYPLGTGMVPLDEILSRIRILTQTQPGQEF